MENYLLDIEAYLDGSMSESERRSFEEKLQANPPLREELKEFQALRTDLAFHYAAKDVAEAVKQRAEYEKKKRVRTWILLSLLVATLAGVIFLWNNGLRIKPSESPGNQPVNTPSIQAPVTPQGDNLQKEIENNLENEPTVLPVEPKSRPMAGNRPLGDDSSNDRYRDLPKEPVSAVYQQFFTTSMQSFVPAVRPKGIWKQAVQELDQHRPGKAHQLLKKLPADALQNDTTQYLLAVSELQMQRPAAAEDLLYPLIATQKWQTEGRYLLVWAYLLEGNAALAKSSLQLLPDAYRDKHAIVLFLEK